MKIPVHSWLSLSYCLLAIGCWLPSNAQPKNISSSEILHRIEGLKTVATVLYIAAHPDDENTRLITYLEKDKHYRVAYLSLTRGEGGQNLIGDEQGMDLGILRTQELLAARKIDGGEQFFSTAYDFGYSKTPEETLKKWNRNKIREDILTVMNHLQPDIVICRFPTTGEGGHGHHTASAILAEEAFDTLVERNGSYVPKKLYWNTFNFGNRNTTSEDQLKIDVGGYNPLLGKSYGEIAAEARSMHRCQAFGSERKRGEQFEYFKSLRDNTPKLGNSKPGLMEGIVTDWSRYKGGEIINKKIDEIIKKFDVKDPSASVKDLIILKGQLEKLDKENANSKIISKRISEIDELILDCAGIYIEVLNNQSVQNIKDSLHLKLSGLNRSGLNCKLNGIYIPFLSHDIVFNESNSIDFLKNKLVSKTINFVLDKIESPFISSSYPVYEELILFPNMYSLYKRYLNENTEFRSLLPEFKNESQVILDFEIDGKLIAFSVQLQYKYIDPSFGEIYQPVFFNVNDSLMNNFELKQIKYDHIPTQIYYTKPDPVLKFDYLKAIQKKIAYISGAGDKIPDILSQMGYDVTLLTENNISSFDLSGFTSIVTGVRAYNTGKWLEQYNDEFFKYVEKGGNLLIQYNTSNGLAAQPPQFFNYEITRERVTEEESKVIIRDTTLDILNYPNKIREEDFEGWVQEYGLYFPLAKDFNFIQPFSMNDTDEKPNLNSVIYCRFGKGKFVYTGLSFFRELPAGVEGATKLFVNLMEDNSPELLVVPKLDIEKIPTIEGEKKRKTKNK
jgi:LmbE family N-acetylglucosaminyl deacetylase